MTTTQRHTITEDTFIHRFKPETNPDGSLYVARQWHTFGEKCFLEMMHQKRRLWTLVDGDDGEPTIVQGYAMVNRLYYIVCEVPYPEHETIEVLTGLE